MQNKQLAIQVQESTICDPCSQSWQLYACTAEYPEYDMQKYLHSKLLQHLAVLGINPKLSGFHCILAACNLQLTDPNMLMKEIYPEVAKINGLSDGSCAERNIRTAITNAWQKGNGYVWECYFPQHTNCPTNKEFIKRLSQLL